ncbi:MAG: hypothetical protein FWG25_01735 [Promicromonosporaceae bacterium]|nr:hypothetical protein [Promicromonosporaceae bacterium]
MVTERATPLSRPKRVTPDHDVPGSGNTFRNYSETSERLQPYPEGDLGDQAYLDSLAERWGQFATLNNGEAFLQSQAEGDLGQSQEWFWTQEWQAGEREADADKTAGRVTHFGSGEEFISWLKNH